MKTVDIAKIVSKTVVPKEVNADSMLAIMKAEGGSVELISPEDLSYRYLVMDLEIQADHSIPFELNFYRKGEDNYRIAYRFGLLPRVKTHVALDLTLIDSRQVFNPRTPGLLKLVIHGNRTLPEEVEKITFGTHPCFEDTLVLIENVVLTNEEPKSYPLPPKKLIDEFGQWTGKDWKGKIHSEKELKEKLLKLAHEPYCPLPGRTQWGGEHDCRLTPGTGFFSTVKTSDGRWHMTDPDGYAFFSMGCDCVNPGNSARVDDLEEMCTFPAPPMGDTIFETRHNGQKGVNFTKLNLMRVFGEDWLSAWRRIAENVLLSAGMNTVANWSHPTFQEGEKRIAYVYQPDIFPDTTVRVFRDFPDVLSEEYSRNAEILAQNLMKTRDDPWMIGYFLRNEPEFAFVPGLLIADEALANPVETACKKGVIGRLKEKYEQIAALNQVWGSSFESFEALGKQGSVVETYPSSRNDLSVLSVWLVEAYVGIPSTACRKVDSNHLNLGMRWAMANNPEQMAGWQYFDVFSINNYSFSPYSLIDYVASVGVDLPIMVGEFHFGALDRGLPATGLKGVQSQDDRARALRGYFEKCAAHKNAVGAHWFQFCDQSALGRFDGENYQIGLTDVAVGPYEEMIKASKESAAVIAKVKNGEIAPYDEPFREIPMIGY